MKRSRRWGRSVVIRVPLAVMVLMMVVLLFVGGVSGFVQLGEWLLFSRLRAIWLLLFLFNNFLFFLFLNFFFLFFWLSLLSFCFLLTFLLFDSRFGVTWLGFFFLIGIWCWLGFLFGLNLGSWLSFSIGSWLDSWLGFWFSFWFSCWLGILWLLWLFRLSFLFLLGSHKFVFASL